MKNIFKITCLLIALIAFPLLINNANATTVIHCEKSDQCHKLKCAAQQTPACESKECKCKWKAGHCSDIDTTSCTCKAHMFKHCSSGKCECSKNPDQCTSLTCMEGSGSEGDSGSASDSGFGSGSGSGSGSENNSGSASDSSYGSGSGNGSGSLNSY